jgi:ATP-binding cassette, subfamily B, bacterial
MAAHPAGRVTSARDIFLRFWPYTKGDRLRLLLGGMLTIILAACEISSVLLFEVIVSKVLQKGHLAGFWGPAATWLGVAAVGALAMSGSSYVTALAAERFMLRLRDSVFARAQRLSPDFFAERRLGDLMVRLTDDIGVIEGLVSSGVVSLVTSVVSVMAFATAVFVIRWDLALVAFAIAPLFWLAARGFSGQLAKAAQRERAASGSIASAVEESLSNQALVQAFNRQETEARRLHDEGVSWLRARMAETRLDSIYGPLVYVIETFCVLVVFGVGAWDLVSGRISLAGLLAFAAFLAFLYPPAASVSGFVLGVSEASASSARITEILEFRPAVADGTALRSRLRSRGRIEFDNVTFGYPGADAPVLDRLSFTAEPGRLLAVTGPSGSGKSTITRLLLRFYDPAAGRILLDGVDIREMSLRTLRYNITLLQQENLMFPGTVRENISYGRSGLSERQVVAAARAADADAFISALPGGYDALVGQRGRLLSGGQRQRIAVARAIARDAPVLLLDEPTTGLDSASAARMMGRLSQFMAGRTAIFITHDPRLVAGAGDVLTLGGARPGSQRAEGVLQDRQPLLKQLLADHQRRQEAEHVPVGPAGEHDQSRRVAGLGDL